MYYRHSGYPGGLKETNLKDFVGYFPRSRDYERSVGHVATQQAWACTFEEVESLCRT